jgi:hypothetical protein
MTQPTLDQQSFEHKDGQINESVDSRPHWRAPQMKAVSIGDVTETNFSNNPDGSVGTYS